MATTSALFQDMIGREIDAIPTPALLVDLPALKRNLAAMQGMVSEHGKSLRPHVKTHKCGRVAHMQMEAGAVGVTCATPGEAEAMAAAGIRDILIANQFVSREKLDRLARLAGVCALKFAVDSPYGVDMADQVARQHGITFEVLVEVNTGGNRCGVTSPQEAVELVRRVLDRRGLRFGGIQAYVGGTSYIADLGEREQAVAASDRALEPFLDSIRPLCDIPRVSGAGSGNAVFHLRNGLLTEIQAGSYVYSDTTYRALAPEYENALFVLATNISRPTGSRIVLDVGLKGMGTEFSRPELAGYPHIRECHFSEEHLQWQVESDPCPAVGEKVRIIPSHCCSTVNLHRRIFVVQDRKVVDVWEIDGF